MRQFNNFPVVVGDLAPRGHEMPRSVPRGFEPDQVIECTARHPIRVEDPNQLDLSCIFGVRVTPPLHRSDRAALIQSGCGGGHTVDVIRRKAGPGKLVVWQRNPLGKGGLRE